MESLSVEFIAIGLSILIALWVGFARLTSRIDSRLSQVVDGLERVEGALDKHDRKLAAVQMTQVEHTGRLSGIEKSVNGKK